MLLQRQRDTENQIVVYHIEQKPSPALETSQPVSREAKSTRLTKDETLSRFAPVDLTTLQVYEEFR